MGVIKFPWVLGEGRAAKFGCATISQDQARHSGQGQFLFYFGDFFWSFLSELGLEAFGFVVFLALGNAPSRSLLVHTINTETGSWTQKRAQNKALDEAKPDGGELFLSALSAASVHVLDQSRHSPPVGRKWRVGKERGRCAWVWPLAVDHQFVDQVLRTPYKEKFMLSASKSLFSFLVIGLVQLHEQTGLVKLAAKSHDGSWKSSLVAS
jgi:hypothetical protein